MALALFASVASRLLRSPTRLGIIVAALAAPLGVGACASGQTCGLTSHDPPQRHRPARLTCVATSEPQSCDAGSACTDATGTTPGVCVTVDGGAGCRTDQCQLDSDCADGGVCSCKGATVGWSARSPGNSCVPGNCRTDHDCKSGYCSPSVSFDSGPFYGVQGYYCHSCDDTCTNDSDCQDDSGAGYCGYDRQVGHWACGYNFGAG
jgi:hypothetical protein